MITQDHDSGGERLPGLVNDDTRLSNGEISFDTEEEMLASWEKRSIDLMNEMLSMGYAAMIVYAGCDPLEEVNERSACAYRIYRGNRYTIMGFLSSTLHQVNAGDL